LLSERHSFPPPELRRAFIFLQRRQRDQRGVRGYTPGFGEDRRAAAGRGAEEQVRERDATSGDEGAATEAEQ